MNHRIQGFTLLEMLVVLVILGLLAGLVGPRLFSQADAAKVKTADTQIKMLKGALETMRLDINRYPTTEEGLQLLQSPPRDENIKPYWKGPYLSEDQLPLDPWNRPYHYEFLANNSGSRNRQFVLYSFGADGQSGGVDYNADIGYTP